MTDAEAYRDGVRDGKVAALEEMVSKHSTKLDNHERILAALIGVFGFIQAMPTLREFVGG